MESGTHPRLIKFLKEELAVPAAAIALGLRNREHDANQLPMILWQYGLITLDQLNRVFDWLETA